MGLVIYWTHCYCKFEFNNVILSIAALVSVLPELVAESDPREALKQVACPPRKHAYSYSEVNV